MLGKSLPLSPCPPPLSANHTPLPPPGTHVCYLCKTSQFMEQDHRVKGGAWRSSPLAGESGGPGSNPSSALSSSVAWKSHCAPQRTVIDLMRMKRPLIT